jgi:hypothetical protein
VAAKQVMVVTVARSGISEAEQRRFQSEMAERGIDVVYLFHSPNWPGPSVELFQAGLRPVVSNA